MTPREIRAAFHNGDGAAVVRWVVRVGAVAGAFITVCGAVSILQARLIAKPIEDRARQIEVRIVGIERRMDSKEQADSVLRVRVNNISEGQEHLPTRADVAFIVRVVREQQAESEWKAQRRALEQRRYADSLAHYVRRRN